MESFAFGGEKSERVEVQVHGYERTPVGEYFDDNWVRASVIVRAGAYSGRFDAAFLNSDFVGFRQELGTLYEALAGAARFSTLEEQLTLDLTGDGLGHIELKGVTLDAPGIGNRLEFQFSLDQGHLPPAIQGLDGILSSFPVRAG